MAHLQILTHTEHRKKERAALKNIASDSKHRDVIVDFFIGNAAAHFFVWFRNDCKAECDKKNQNNPI